jgi:hypothetical protein
MQVRDAETGMKALKISMERTLAPEGYGAERNYHKMKTQTRRKTQTATNQEEGASFVPYPTVFELVRNTQLSADEENETGRRTREAGSDRDEQGTAEGGAASRAGDKMCDLQTRNHRGNRTTHLRRV